MTATGRIFPCLGGGEIVDLRTALRTSKAMGAIDEALDLAMRLKPERHRIEIAASAPAVERHMSVTGG